VSKPLVFISHIHEDARISAALEDLIKESLLGGVEVFNTSNRVPLAPGEPWRDLIIQNLRGCVAALVVATPQSVSSPWVNFKGGGAWISEKRVIPCCARGMRRTSLPAPLRDLQALETTDPDDIRQLIGFLANAAGLDEPKHINYVEKVNQLEESWTADARNTDDEDLNRWIEAAVLRPRKHKDEKVWGVFEALSPRPVDRTETSQFHGYGSCSSLSRRLVGVGVPALVGLLGLVLVASAP
jgi:hypothetical protein